MSKQALVKPYLWVVIAFGAAVTCFSVYRLATAGGGDLGWAFLILFAVTIAAGRRMIIQIPQGNGEISVVDIFIFITLLDYSGEAAVLLAAAEALYSKTRFNSKPTTILFAGSVMTCSTSLTVWATRLCFGTNETLAHNLPTPTFITLLSVIALVQYVSNTGLVAVAVALKRDEPIWGTWKRYYLWASITYFVGAFAAGGIVKIVNVFHFYAVAALSPIAAILYFTYRTYLKNVEISVAQAEQAKAHVEELNRHIAEREQAEEQFRATFEQAAVGIAHKTLDGKCLLVNDKLCAILGYTRDELLEIPFTEITHPDDLEKSFEHFRRTSTLR